MNKNVKVQANQNRAVIYARFSSARQNEATIETQKRCCHEYAKKYGKTVIDVYVDEKRSGTTDRRTGFQQLMQDARIHKFDYVILYAENRFSRNYTQSKKYFFELRDLGIHIITRSTNYEEQDDLVADILWNVIAKQSEQYSIDLAKVVTDGLQNNLNDGLSIGGQCLLGYQTNSETKRIEIAPDEAPVVEYLFKQIAQGMPLVQVCENINRYGYRAAGGRNFTINSFQNALRNRKYIGEYTVRGTSYPNHYPPLIETALFERVQNILNEKSHANGRGKAKGEYLLSGKVFCGYCGNRLNGTTAYKQGTPHYYYSCSNNYASRRTCQKRSESKVQLETGILKAIKKHLYGSLYLEKAADMIAKQCTKRFRDEFEKPLRRELDSIELNIDKRTTAFANTTSDHVRQNLERQIEAFEIKRKHKQAKLDNGYAGQSETLTRDILKFVKEVLASDNTDTNLCRYILNSFVNAVYVYEDRIEVVYLFTNNDEKLPLSDRLPCTVYEKNINQG